MSKILIKEICVLGPTYLERELVHGLDFVQIIQDELQQ